MVDIVLNGVKAIIIAAWDKFADLVKAVAALVKTKDSTGS